MSGKIRVAILDDHQGIVDGYQYRLGGDPDIVIVDTGMFGEDLERIELLVEDDGVGFVAKMPLDLAWLLASKHFGLAGMHERAALIGAQLEIYSAIHQGTRVRVQWSQRMMESR